MSDDQRYDASDDPVDRRWEELVMAKNIHIAKTMREDIFLSKEFDPIGG